MLICDLDECWMVFADEFSTSTARNHLLSVKRRDQIACWWYLRWLNAASLRQTYNFASREFGRSFFTAAHHVYGLDRDVIWGGRRGSNPRHSVPQTDALPAELRPPPRAV